MQKLLEIRRRMRSVESIRNVARSVATVASTKLSRTRDRAGGLRAYSERMRGVIRNQQAYAETAGIDVTRLSPFLQRRPDVRRVTLLHLAGDRGMCGNYNILVNRLALEFVWEKERAGIEVGVVAKGVRGERFLRRKTDVEVEAEGWPRAGVTAEEVDRLVERLGGEYLSGGCDEVWCTCTRFYSPLHREPRLVRLLPLSAADSGDAAAAPLRWYHEPGFEDVLAELVRLFLRLQVEDVLLESYAAEQGARMITMEEATERASKMLHDLKVRHNRLRREVITSDLLGVLFASRMREGDEAVTGGTVT